MTTGGGLVSTMAEADDLEMTRCYTEDVGSLTPRFNRLSGIPRGEEDSIAAPGLCGVHRTKRGGDLKLMQ